MKNNFKKGDKVRSKKTGKIYTLVDIDLCKIEDENLQVWSADLEWLEPVVESHKQLEKELLMESVQFGGSDPYGGMPLREVLATVKLEDIDPPDYAAEAKDLLCDMIGHNKRSPHASNFVDLIIKAAKQ